MSTLLTEAAQRKIPAIIDGKQVHISSVQATTLQLATLAAAGNLKAMIEFLDRMADLETRAAAARPSEYPLSDADLEIIREVHSRLWQYEKREE